MTQGGYLISWSNISSSYHLVMHDDNYRSYSVMASAPSSPLVAIGNIHGSLKVVLLDDHSTSESEIKASDGNVFNVTWATNKDLFSTGMDGELTWWKVRTSPSLALLAHAHFTLPPCKQRWATSVTLYGEDQFVCGDRRGSVHLFQRSHVQNNRPGPKSSVPGIHGKAGTSFVCQHDGSVYSAGRDGTYRQYYITDGGEIRLENTHKVYKGFEWLEKLVFTEDGDLHVMGFHSVNFVVWSTLNNEALLTVPCGGGHRSWDLSTLDDGSMTFACIKMKQLLVHSVSSAAWQRQTILKDDIHGREITCIKFLRTVQIAGQDHHVCVTGSEDTKVNIVSFSSPRSSVDPSSSSALLGDINVLHRLHAHVSSVRALAVCHSSSSTDEMLLFSVGGRYSMNCWKVKFCLEASNTSSLKQICTVRHLVSHSSLITTRSRQKLRQREKLLDDPETRFLGVSVWRRGDVQGVSPGTGGGHVMMCVASSDAFLRFFCFDEDTCKITPLGSSNMHDCCLLCVTSIRLTCDPEVKARVKPRTMVLTGGTDGRILVWDVQEVQSQAGKLTIDASICDDEEEKEDEEEDEEEEERIVGAAARSQNNIEKEFNKTAKTRRGMEIDEPKKATMRERRKVENEAVIQLHHGNHKPSNTAGNETVSSSIGSSGACQSAIENDVSQLDKHHISVAQGREGGAAGGGIDGKPSHQGTSSSGSSSAERTSGCHRTQGHSSSTATSLSYDGEENIQSVSMVTQAKSPTAEAAASTIQSSTSDVQSMHTRHTGHSKERSVQSKETTAGLVTSDPVGGHDTGSVGQMVSSWSAHQSGINALALHLVKDDKFVVVSGGDDTAMTVTLVNLSSSICTGDEAMTGAVLDTCKIPKAHATQITGIRFIQLEHTFLSVSVDQRLNRWRLKLSVDYLKIEEVKMVSSSFVHVSDIAGLDTWNERSTSQQYAVICGQGLQLMDISSNEEESEVR
eukprot:XP_790551.3 PREDICTED: WD repeat-containing protein 6 [Strongylocentrotus purpuratus]